MIKRAEQYIYKADTAIYYDYQVLCITVGTMLSRDGQYYWSAHTTITTHM